MRHDRGLAASPPARYKLKVERSMPSTGSSSRPARIGTRDCGRPYSVRARQDSRRTNCAPTGTSAPAASRPPRPDPSLNTPVPFTQGQSPFLIGSLTPAPHPDDPPHSRTRPSQPPHVTRAVWLLPPAGALGLQDGGSPLGRAPSRVAVVRADLPVRWSGRRDDGDGMGQGRRPGARSAPDQAPTSHPPRGPLHSRAGGMPTLPMAPLTLL
jgi:hypothetical protein